MSDLDVIYKSQAIDVIDKYIVEAEKEFNEASTFYMGTYSTKRLLLLQLKRDIENLR